MGMNSIFTETNPGNNHSFLAFFIQEKSSVCHKVCNSVSPYCLYLLLEKGKEMSGLGENEKKIFKLNFNSCLEIFLFQGFVWCFIKSSYFISQVSWSWRCRVGLADKYLEHSIINLGNLDSLNDRWWHAAAHERKSISFIVLESNLPCVSFS